MVGPEVDHHLVQLSLGEGGAHDRQVRELAAEATLPLRHRVLVRSLRAVRAGGALALATFTLRVEVQLGQIATVVVEDVEGPLALGECVIINLGGGELPVDPLHHARGRDAVDLSRAGTVGEAVERVQSRVARRENRGLRGRPTQGPRGQYPAHTRQDPGLHTVILTHSLRETLRY